MKTSVGDDDRPAVRRQDPGQPPEKTPLHVCPSQSRFRMETIIEERRVSIARSAILFG
jgi:hypothetical protein